jgi:hypothetical protein
LSDCPAVAAAGDPRERPPMPMGPSRSSQADGARTTGPPRRWRAARRIRVGLPPRSAVVRPERGSVDVVRPPVLPRHVSWLLEPHRRAGDRRVAQRHRDPPGAGEQRGPRAHGLRRLRRRTHAERQSPHAATSVSASQRTNSPAPATTATRAAAMTAAAMRGSSCSISRSAPSASPNLSRSEPDQNPWPPSERARRAVASHGLARDRRRPLALVVVQGGRRAFCGGFGRRARGRRLGEGSLRVGEARSPAVP